MRDWFKTLHRCKTYSRPYYTDEKQHLHGYAATYLLWNPGIAAILSLLVWIYQTSRHKIYLWTQIDLIKSYLKLSVKKKKKKRKHKFSFFFSPFLISGETTVPIFSQTKQWMLSIRITHPNRCSCTWLTKLYIAHWRINQCKLHRIWLTSLKTAFRMRIVEFLQRWLLHWINLLER